MSPQTSTVDTAQPPTQPSTGQPTEQPSTGEVSTSLAELRLAQDAVGNKDWLSAELLGEPVVSLDMLGSTASPLSALSSAGCDFLTPMISFLEEPLGQLRGEPDSVSGPSAEHDGAAQEALAVGDEYASSVDKETSEWSGSSKTNYLETAQKLTEGIKTIGETAATNAKAIMAAGEVVAQVVDIVTRLITECVGKIVPIMTEAIAAAPATFGASIAKAIPECVAIAVDYGSQILGKVGALVASGENLVTLLEGAVGVLDVVNEGMKVIGDLASGESSGGDGSEQSSSSDSSSDGSSDSSAEDASSEDDAEQPEEDAAADEDADTDEDRDEDDDSDGDDDEDNDGDNDGDNDNGERERLSNPLDGEWKPRR